MNTAQAIGIEERIVANLHRYVRVPQFVAVTVGGDEYPPRIIHAEACGESVVLVRNQRIVNGSTVTAIYVVSTVGDWGRRMTRTSTGTIHATDESDADNIHTLEVQAALLILRKHYGANNHLNAFVLTTQKLADLDRDAAKWWGTKNYHWMARSWITQASNLHAQVEWEAAAVPQECPPPL